MGVLDESITTLIYLSYFRGGQFPLLGPDGLSVVDDPLSGTHIVLFDIKFPLLYIFMH